MIGFICRAWPADQSGDVVRAVDNKEYCEREPEFVAGDEVAREHTGHDRDGGGHHQRACKVGPDAPEPAMAPRRGDGDDEVNDHGGGHVEMVGRGRSLAEDLVQGGEHDHRAADAGQAAEQTGDEADTHREDDREGGERHRQPGGVSKTWEKGGARIVSRVLGGIHPPP
jgi:hypothetical protein